MPRTEIDGTQIKDGSITSTDIENGTITPEDIAQGAILPEHLSSGVIHDIISGVIYTITTEQLVSGITAETHETLPTLTHALAQSAIQEIIRDNRGRISAIIYWEDATKTKKVRESIYDRNDHGFITGEHEIQYKDGIQDGILHHYYTRSNFGWIVGGTMTRG